MGGYFSRAIPKNGLKTGMPTVTKDVTTGWTYVYHVPLVHGRKYRFDAWNIGSFPITGGKCDYFTVELDVSSRIASIYDEDGLVFSEDQVGDRITVQDDANGDGSVVILTVQGRKANFAPIPINVDPNDAITLTGARSFIITGNGARLVHGGSGLVTVNGSLQLLQQDGLGLVTVKGSVTGDVVITAIGGGKIIIEGSVEGNLIQIGGGSIEVKGDVKGNLDQRGDGSIQVYGGHFGTVMWAQIGSIKVDFGKQEKKEEVGSGDA